MTVRDWGQEMLATFKFRSNKSFPVSIINSIQCFSSIPSSTNLVKVDANSSGVTNLFLHVHVQT